MQGPGDEIFLEMFEDEYNNEKVLQESGADSLNLIPSTPPPSPFYTPLTSTHTQSFHVKLPLLMMDASMLLPPTDTPLTGIEFTRRLPCGETERARKVKEKYLGAMMSVQGNQENVLHTHTHIRRQCVYSLLSVS